MHLCKQLMRDYRLTLRDIETMPFTKVLALYGDTSPTEYINRDEIGPREYWLRKWGFV